MSGRRSTKPSNDQCACRISSSHGRNIWGSKRSESDFVRNPSDRAALPSASRSGAAPRCRVQLAYRQDSTHTGRPRQIPQVLKERMTFLPSAVHLTLNKVEQQCFDFAIRSERLLSFGNQAGDIFGEYRESAVRELAKIGIDESLAAIDANLRLGTGEGAKLAILGCRNILIALSNKLWQVPSLTVHPTLTTYDGKPLQLDTGQIKARLRAYLHERDVVLATGRGPTLIAGQLDRIADTLDQLYNLSSEQGKNEALVPEAKSAALQTFFLIGEIARLTGLEPVTVIADQTGTSVSAGSTS